MNNEFEYIFIMSKFNKMNSFRAHAYYFGIVVLDCKIIMSSLRDFVCSHIKRKAN